MGEGPEVADRIPALLYAERVRPLGHARAPSAEGDDVEVVARGLPGHEGGVREVRGREPETARLAAAAVAGRPVAAGAVLGEHRLSPRRGGRLGRQGLIADSRARRDVRGDRLDAG